MIREIELQIEVEKSNYKYYHGFPEIFKITIQIALIAISIILNSAYSLVSFVFFLGITLIDPDRMYFFIFRDSRSLEYKTKLKDLYHQKKLLVDQAIKEFDQNHSSI